MGKARVLTVSIYCIASVFVLLSMVLQEMNIDIEYADYIRPTLILFLAIAAVFSLMSRQTPKPIMLFMTTALLSYSFGDLLDFFYHGEYTEWVIMSYFVAALCYMLILFSNIRHNNMHESAVTKKKAIYYIFSCIILPLSLVQIIAFNSNISIYISVYAWAIFSLGFYSFRCWYLAIKKSVWILLGVIALIISHSLLLLSMLKDLHFPFIVALGLFSYLLSQTLIVYGLTNLYQSKRSVG